MLAALRTTRRILGGALALLVVSSWLSVAVAACLEHGGPQDGDAHAGMASAMAEMSHDCPHCDSVAVDMACADNVADCELPAAVLPSNSDETKFAAIAPSTAGDPSPRLNPAIVPAMAADPPVPTGRDRHILFCSFQE